MKVQLLFDELDKRRLFYLSLFSTLARSLYLYPWYTSTVYPQYLVNLTISQYV